MRTVLLLLLVFTVNSFAQTSTEKYNSLMKRYEYFDNRGYMTGYKQYNNLLKQWEYFNSNNSSYQGYQAQPPQPNVDLNLTREVLKSKQQRYDYNNQRLQDAVNAIFKTLPDHDSKIEFRNYVAKNINGSSNDLSYDSVTNQLINNLYIVGENLSNKAVKKSVKEAPIVFDGENKTDKINEAIRQNTVSNLISYKGLHEAKSVQEYKYFNNQWILVETDTRPSQINYYDYFLTFKRSHLEKPYVRYLFFEGYNSKDNFYFYSSDYGDVHIYGGFKTVVLFDKVDGAGKPTNKYIFNF